ncbi:MAG TPA: hypothetical protein PKM88_07865 [bacterium]|nr:hypothetical protein [bacterium]
MNRVNGMLRLFCMVTVLVLMLSGVTMPAYATSQRPDYIIYHDSEYLVPVGLFVPSLLEIFYLTHPEHPYPVFKEFGTSTACNRSHIATWEITDGRFYLQKLEYRIGYAPWYAPMAIPDEIERMRGQNGKIPMDWFSGYVTIRPLPGRSFPVRAGAGHYDFVIVKIVHGRVVREETYCDDRWRFADADDSLHSECMAWMRTVYKVKERKLPISALSSLAPEVPRVRRVWIFGGLLAAGVLLLGVAIGLWRIKRTGKR